MYRKATDTNHLVFDFYISFGGKLDPKNRWVVLSRQTPWDYMEEVYKETLSGSAKGYSGLSERIAFGVLVIKEQFGTSDKETVAQVKENLCQQYFLVLKKYSYETLFDDCEITRFRERLTKEMLQEKNERILTGGCERGEEHNDDSAIARSYGFKNDRVFSLTMHHALGKLLMPETINKYL